jgi:hypothetical protein
VTAPDASGGFFVAWCDGRDSAIDLYLQHIDIAGNLVPGWPANGLRACNAPGNQTRASAVADGSGGVFLVWDDTRTGVDQVFAHHILSNGTIAAGWPPTGLLITSSGSPILPFGGYNNPRAAAASDGAGGFLVTWSEKRSGFPFYAIYCQRITGTGAIAPGWTPGGQKVSGGAAYDQTKPMIVGYEVGNGMLPGRAMIAWMAPGLFTTDIYVQALNESGGAGNNWPAGGIGLVSAFNGFHAIDLQDVAPWGGIMLVYTYQYLTSCPGGTPCPPNLLVSTRPWAFYYSGSRLVDAPLSGLGPFSDVIADENGFVAWNEIPSSGPQAAKLQQADFNPSGVNPNFPASGLVLAGLGGVGGVVPRPIAIASSHAYFNPSNADVVVTTQSRAYAVRTNGQMRPGWPINGLDFSGINTSQGQVSLVRYPSADNYATGGALIGWVDSRMGLDMYAQLISATGVVAADLVPPGAPAVYSQGGCYKIIVSWSNAGDDGTIGQAVAYQIRRSLTAITSETAWNAATYVSSGVPLGSGQLQTDEDLVGACSARYYYAVKLQDDAGNWSSPGGTSTWSKTLCPGPEDPPCEDAGVHRERTEADPGPAVFDLAPEAPTILRAPTRLQFQVPRALRGKSLSLQIVDLNGRIVRRIEAGTVNGTQANTSWDLRSENGRWVAAGVYFLRARLGQTTLTRRFIVIR